MIMSLKTYETKSITNSSVGPVDCNQDSLVSEIAPWESWETAGDLAWNRLAWFPGWKVWCIFGFGFSFDSFVSFYTKLGKWLYFCATD